MADSIGVLTPSFTAPARCATPLASCSTLGGRFIQCTPVYGQTCGPNGTPTLAAECFPNGKNYATHSYFAPTYSPGDACPSQYKAVHSSSFTTTQYYTTGPGAGQFATTYFKATVVQCCPTDYAYSQAGPCVSGFSGGPAAVYFCDFDTTLTATVTMPAYATQIFTYGTLMRAENSMPTTMYNFAHAGGIEYIEGFVGTGPWTTSSSSVRYYTYGGGSGGGGSSGSGSSSGSSFEASRRKNRTTKIAIGVAVPVALAVLSALLLLCLKKNKKKKHAPTTTTSPTMTTTPVPPTTHGQPMVQSLQPPYVAAQNAQNAQPYYAPPPSSPLTTFFTPSPAPPSSHPNGNGPPPVYAPKQNATVGVDERTQRLAQLEADKARIDDELARMRQAALEEEQRRVVGEIERLRR